MESSDFSGAVLSHSSSLTEGRRGKKRVTSKRKRINKKEIFGVFLLIVVDIIWVGSAGLTRVCLFIYLFIYLFIFSIYFISNPTTSHSLQCISRLFSSLLIYCHFSSGVHGKGFAVVLVVDFVTEDKKLKTAFLMVDQ